MGVGSWEGTLALLRFSLAYVSPFVVWKADKECVSL